MIYKVFSGASNLLSNFINTNLSPAVVHQSLTYNEINETESN